MKTKRHLAINIDGLISYHGKRKIRILMHEDGTTMTDREAREYLAECKSKGYRLIPNSDCEGFDPFGKGCPGHIIKK